MPWCCMGQRYNEWLIKSSERCNCKAGICIAITNILSGPTECYKNELTRLPSKADIHNNPHSNLLKEAN